VVKRIHGGPRGPDKSVRNTTKSQARNHEDHAVVVHACKLRDTPFVAREQSIQGVNYKAVRQPRHQLQKKENAKEITRNSSKGILDCRFVVQGICVERRYAFNTPPRPFIFSVSAVVDDRFLTIVYDT
jgi:hypothetical protein|tara:strand:- start:103 stop:486 length:384 start_codon:yes stop_codon:yes gene_type:complete